MYTKNDVQQFENVVNALAENGVLNREVCVVALTAVQSRLEPTFTMDEFLLHRTEAAELLKCSTKTVDRLCDEGKLTRIHTSKRAIRIRLSELRQMLGI